MLLAAADSLIQFFGESSYPNAQFGALCHVEFSNVEIERIQHQLQRRTGELRARAGQLNEDPALVVGISHTSNRPAILKATNGLRCTSCCLHQSISELPGSETVGRALYTKCAQKGEL